MNLFSPFTLGRMSLPNRLVMAPMTRSRATGAIPNALMRTYYTQRATAGLIVTEGTAPSPNGQGYARIPGLYSDAQIEGWRSITDAVHAEGGRIVVQLMHTGRIGHALNLPPGARVLGPSAVAAGGTMYTDQQGPQPHPTPEVMSATDVTSARDEFVQAAKNAIAAGFDAIELHSANGYLLEQFLNPHSNRRDDAYGGSHDKRNAFVLEVARACADAIGADRVGIRLSPHGTNGDFPARDTAEVREQFVALARGLRGLLYVHVVGNGNPDAGQTAQLVREAFGGPVILNGGFDRARADAEIAAGHADLVSIGRPYVSNPDLAARLEKGTPLAPFRHEQFFTPGPEGYTDYPAA